MKLSILKEFVVLAEELNFTKAASRLYVSQPALSKHISDLEQSLGAALLVRDRHTVSLTEAGETAYRHFKEMLAEYASLESNIAALQAASTSAFRFGALYYGTELVHPVLTALGKRFPNYQPSLFYFQPVPLADALDAGEIDVAITYHYSYEHDARFEFHDFTTDRAVLVVAEGHQLAGAQQASLADLQGETIVVLRAQPYIAHVLSLLDAAGLHEPALEYCDQIDALDLAVQKSGGVSIMPESIRNMARAGICLVPVEDEDARFTWSVVYKKGSANPAIKPILQTVDELF